MRITLLLFASLAAIPAVASPSSPSAIALSRNPIVAGDSLSLHWYVTGTKVMLSGGRFGAGVVVTGRTFVSDRPVQNTKYTLDLWYPDTSAGNAAPSSKLIHAQYTTTVQVLHPDTLGLEVYRDTRGWRILHPKGWSCDKVALPDPARNALMYFQQEADSLERLAVSVLPVTEHAAESLMKRVEVDLPSHYDEVQVISKQDVTIDEQPAVLAEISGKDHTHSGARTHSVILVFVREGLGYVVSARTAAARYSARQPLLRNLVRSFAFLPGPAARRQATTGGG